MADFHWKFANPAICPASLFCISLYCWAQIVSHPTQSILSGKIFLLFVLIRFFVFPYSSSFPFLNFMGLFVASALGADDIFVAVDKWKNARIHNQSGSTEDVAAVALPNAASAMLLTTSTTAVAFFATTICPG